MDQKEKEKERKMKDNDKFCENMNLVLKLIYFDRY